MDPRRRKSKPSSNKVHVADQSLLQTLDKNLTALQKAQEMSQAADSGEEDNGLEGILRSSRNKMLSTATKIIRRPQPATIDKVSEPDRITLRKLFKAIESVRRSDSTGEELQQQIRLEFEGASDADNAGNGEPMDINQDSQLLSWKPPINRDRDIDFDFDMPDIPEEAFRRR